MLLITVNYSKSMFIRNSLHFGLLKYGKNSILFVLGNILPIRVY